MKKIKFIRQKNLTKKLKKVWRKPKGRHSKLRNRKRGKGPIVRIGYKKSEEKKIGLIYSVKDLDQKFDNNTIVRIASSVGMKKRLEVVKRAKEKDVKIDNVKDYDMFIKKAEDNIKKRKEEAKKVKEEKKEVKKVEEKKEKKIDEKEEKRKVLEKR